MQITELSTAEPYQEDIGAMREGRLWSRMLLHGREGALDNYRMDISLSEEEWTTPRHRHTFDQVRYQLEGELVYAKDKILPPGWVGYFPEAIHYGPQIRRVGCKLVLMQFGSCGRGGYMSKAQRGRGFHELAAKGRFEKGIYTHVDDKGVKHNQDGYEAIYEHIMGRKATYLKPRYNEIVTMNPENYEWVDGDAPGVQHKWLGTFTEREFRIGFIRLEPGASFIGGLEKAQEALYLAKGSISHQGRSYGIHSSFGFDANEGATPLTATEPSEIFYFRLPRF